MKVHQAFGKHGTVYEVRGLHLFINGREAAPCDGKGWATVAECKDAADSAEIDERGDGEGLPRRAWKVVDRPDAAPKDSGGKEGER